MNWEWILLEMKINKLETELYDNEKNEDSNVFPIISAGFILLGQNVFSAPPCKLIF